MIRSRLEFRVNRVFQTDGAQVWLVSTSGSWDEISVAEPANFLMVKRDPSVMLPGPTFELDHHATQSLIDELWHAGFRPTGQQHPNEVIQAKDEHLKDLRRALFEGVFGR